MSLTQQLLIQKREKVSKSISARLIYKNPKLRNIFTSKNIMMSNFPQSTIAQSDVLTERQDMKLGSR